MMMPIICCQCQTTGYRMVKSSSIAILPNNYYSSGLFDAVFLNTNCIFNWRFGKIKLGIQRSEKQKNKKTVPLTKE